MLTKALAASRTWLSVINGFFPPQTFGLACQEQLADHRDVQMAHHGLILADLEVRVAQFAFLVLKRALDRPACEGDVQPGFEFVSEWIPDEEPFFFVGMQRIVSPKEVVAAQHLIAASQPDGADLTFQTIGPLSVFLMWNGVHSCLVIGLAEWQSSSTPRAGWRGSSPGL